MIYFLHSYLFSKIKLLSCLLTVLGSAVLAFGLYHVHSLSGVTEGGVLGLTLFLEHCFGISPAVSGALLNLLCYGLGWKMLGKKFLFYSFLGTAGFSLTYGVCERFDPLWPQLAGMPLLAAILGAGFVGIGVGLCVRVGGAPSGDDALAMSISKAVNIEIQWVYLVTDLSVLALSLYYIPFDRIAYSLMTVVLSGQIIGLIQRISFH